MICPNCGGTVWEGLYQWACINSDCSNFEEQEYEQIEEDNE